MEMKQGRPPAKRALYSVPYYRVELDRVLCYRVDRLRLLTDMNAPVLVLIEETELVLRRLYKGKKYWILHFLWFLSTKYLRQRTYDIKLKLHDIGLCTDKDKQGRCYMCDDFYTQECDCGECSEGEEDDY